MSVFYPVTPMLMMIIIILWTDRATTHIFSSVFFANVVLTSRKRTWNTLTVFNTRVHGKNIRGPERGQRWGPLQIGKEQVFTREDLPKQSELTCVVLDKKVYLCNYRRGKISRILVSLYFQTSGPSHELQWFRLTPGFSMVKQVPLGRMVFGNSDTCLF